ncbi:hypothetical protein BK138_07360 [Paenibacillus rhizosphaerae]|uniref:RDD domain-containing protein n=1 Tax=Paenibacillus rhizosphaerae TaxID=297318 RepID=A0A1R1F2K2_9BACL|nr:MULTISPECIES: RDD family protein [Paenibacillus]OMF58339.1 hypothetical protein BK138_07360 [Paenibacillus rhizosphaerae]OXL82926.1 hypothetical protein BCV73_07370 [Paenibacillus sp. SSG-1]
MNRNAGFWIRLGASLVDGLLVGLPIMIVVWMITGKWGNEEWISDTISGLYTLLIPVFWNGYTVGKRICNIRIRKVSDHQPPGIGTMLLRNVVAGLVYGLSFGICAIVSAFMVGLREDKRSIHDFIAGTEVVYD